MIRKRVPPSADSTSDHREVVIDTRTRIAAACAAALLATVLPVAQPPASAVAATTTTPAEEYQGWQNITSRVRPQKRLWPQMAYDSTRGRVVLFGGYWGNPEDLASTSVLEGGRRWHELDLDRLPPVRHGGGMTYDAGHDEIVLFGGQLLSGERFADTWVLANDRWRMRQPITSPPAAGGTRLVYDPVHEESVLFGGLELDGETWVWDGTTWTKRSPAVSPPARSYAAMAYDRASDEVVLHGGADADGDLLRDTWAWDGTTWRELVGAGGPAPIRNASMTSTDDGALLFGGSLGGVPPYMIDQTWGLRDETWQLLDARPPSSGWSSAGLVADEQRDRLVLFGGAKSARDGGGTFRFMDRTMLLRYG